MRGACFPIFGQFFPEKWSVYPLTRRIPSGTGGRSAGRMRSPGRVLMSKVRLLDHPQFSLRFWRLIPPCWAFAFFF